MVEQALSELPNECCGILAGTIEKRKDGRIGRIIQRYPLVSIPASPINYSADPRSLFHAHKDSRSKGLEWLAFYHSHPTSKPIPSKTDIATNYYGYEVVHFILSLKDDEPLTRGWHLKDDGVDEADWKIV